MSGASVTAVNKFEFRDCMSRHAVSVSVVAIQYDEKAYGFSATAICSVSDDPPTLLVCLNRSSSCYDAFSRSKFFSVNVLMPDQEKISNAFGGAKPHDERFAYGAWRRGVTGVPILADASVSFECELTRSIDEATHSIMLGRVLDMQANKDFGTLLYYQRQYVTL